MSSLSIHPVLSKKSSTANSLLSCRTKMNFGLIQFGKGPMFVRDVTKTLRFGQSSYNSQRKYVKSSLSFLMISSTLSRQSKNRCSLLPSFYSCFFFFSYSSCLLLKKSLKQSIIFCWEQTLSSKFLCTSLSMLSKRKIHLMICFNMTKVLLTSLS